MTHNTLDSWVQSEDTHTTGGNLWAGFVVGVSAVGGVCRVLLTALEVSFSVAS